MRDARKRAGTGVADVARALRISQKYLEALEEDRHADLPGTAYAIGFVRSYAEHLHLDGDEVVRRYKVEAAGLGGKKDLVFPKPMSDSGVPGGAVLGLGILFAALAYGVWYWNSTDGEGGTARVEPVPEYMAAKEDKASEPAPEATPETAATEASPESAPETVLETAPGTASDAAPNATPDATPDATPAASPEAAPQTAAKVAETAKITPNAPAKKLPQASVAPESPEDEAPVTDASGSADVVGNAASQAPAKMVKPMPATTASAPDSDSNRSLDQEITIPLKETHMVPEPTDMPIASSPVAPTPAVAAPSAAVSASAEAAEPAERQNEGPSRITVRAVSNSWIQVRDEISDRLLFTRLLRKGDEYKVPNRSGLRLMTGNAGALELLVDNAAVPAIGAIGEVRRSVDLDVDKLKAGTAVSE